MPRFAFKIEYHGAPFAGWQRQNGQQTVQGAFEAALAKLEPDVPSIAAAGRTDAGVHANGQVAHADLQAAWDPFRLSEALNYHLKPHPIAIIACARVDDAWHARFSAQERRYRFRVIQRRAPLALEAGLAWHVKPSLSVEAMQKGAAHLIGQHDFTTFRAALCQAKSPVKTLDEIRITAEQYDGGQAFNFDLRARSFLHNQVRSIVGTLERVGAGAWAPDDIAKVLEARDRAACGPVAPPHGLCLTHVAYPEDPFAR